MKMTCPFEKPGTAYPAKQYHIPGNNNPTEHIFKILCIDYFFYSNPRTLLYTLKH
jgi:hypothetical protein